MNFSNVELLTAVFALTAGYLVYCNVMNRSGSRRAAFWWAFSAAALPVLFIPAYFIFRPKKESAEQERKPQLRARKK